MKFLIFFFLFKIFLTTQVLSKYSSLSTSNNTITFYSAPFSKGDKIYFKIGIVGSYNGKTCKDQLIYQFYDNKTTLNYNKNYTTKATSSQNNGATRFFTIEKSSDKTKDITGSFALLVFDCESSAMITNIEKTDESSSLNSSTLLAVEIIFSILFVVAIILMCFGCIKGQDTCSGNIFFSCCQCLCLSCMYCPCSTSKSKNNSYAKDKESSQVQNVQNNNNSSIKDNNKYSFQSSSERSNVNQIKNPIIIINIQQQNKK